STQAEVSINQKLQNSTNDPLDVTYTITPSIGSCPGEDFDLVVTVHPTPSILFSQEDQTLCTGSDSKEVTFTSDVVGATFTWTADPLGVQGVKTSGNSAIIPIQNLVNPTRSPITIEYKVNVKTSSGGTCSGVPKTYRITVNPSIEVIEDI